MQKRLGLQKITKIFQILFFAALLFAVWYAWDYTKPTNFPIRQVKIVGSYDRLDKKALQDIINSHTKSGFFYINVLGMKYKLLALPWVASAEIRRKWPDIIVVTLVQEEAVAQWGANALINKKLRLFSPPLTTFPPTLPTLFGTKERLIEIFTTYTQAQNILNALTFKIKTMILQPHQYWELQLDNGVILYLKEPQALNQLEFLVKIYNKLTHEHANPPKSIDLRYADGLAVKWE